MKYTRLALLSCSLLLGTQSWIKAEPADAPAAPAASEHKKKDMTELEAKMEKVDRAWKKLRKQVSDPASNASSLELLDTIHQGTQESLKLTPAKAQDVPEADRAKFVADYQEKLKSFIAELETLGVALKENRNEDAAKIFAKLNSLQRESHRAFRRPQS